MPTHPRKHLTKPVKTWGVPSEEVALEALHWDRNGEAAALFAARALANRLDWFARVNYVRALYNGDRYVEAARGFRRLLDEAGPKNPEAPFWFLALGYCLLQLEEDWESLVATTGFLERANHRHSSYYVGLENTACAWNNLGALAESTSLRKAIHLRTHRAPDVYTAGLVRHLWSRGQVLATSRRILGLPARVRRSRGPSWSKVRT